MEFERVKELLVKLRVAQEKRVKEMENDLRIEKEMLDKFNKAIDELKGIQTTFQNIKKFVEKE